MTAYAFSFVVAGATAGITLAILAAVGGDGFANVVIVTVLTLAVTYVMTLRMTSSPQEAVIASMVATAIVVGVGYVLLYAIYDSSCGSNPSSC